MDVAAARPRTTARAGRGLRVGPLLLTLPSRRRPAAGVRRAVRRLRGLQLPHARPLRRLHAVDARTRTARCWRSDVNRTLARNSLVIGLLSAVFSVAHRAADRLLAALRRGALAPAGAVPDRRLDVRELPRAHLRLALDPRHATACSTRALQSLGLIDEPLGFLLYSRLAVTIALVHIFLPYVVLVLYAGFGPVPASLLEAAQDLGANAVQRWAPGDPAGRRRAGGLGVPLRLRALRRRLRDAAVPGRLERRACSGVQIQANFITDGQLGGGRRHGDPDAARLRPRCTCSCARACGCCASTTCGSSADGRPAQPRRRRRHDRGARLPVRAARRRGAVLVPLHGRRSRSPSRAFSLRWYREVFGDAGFRDALLNSAIVAVATSVVTLVLGTMAAYGPEPHLEPPARARSRCCSSCP